SAGARRSRTCGGFDSIDRRYGDAAGGIAARQNLHFDDDQRHGGDAAGALSGYGRTARSALEQAQRYDSERYPEGIYCAGNLHLSAARLDADNHGHLRLLKPRGAELEYDFDFGVPHPRS